MIENAKERENTENNSTERARTTGQGDSAAARNESSDSPVLEKETPRSGTQDTGTEAQGTDTSQSSSLDYGIFQAWLAGLRSTPTRTLEVRDYLWASELYSAPIDVWLKMRAEPYTNPPNDRSIMKFEAAHIVEYIIGLILRRAGILKGEEVRCEYQYPDMLKVTGRMDKLMGGKPDFDKAKAELESMGLPEGFVRASEFTIKALNEKYPNGLEDMPMEIKSVSSFAMDAMERNKVSVKRHRVQLYHYLISGGYKMGKLVYYCRDDARVIEFNIFLDSPVEKEYKEQITLYTKFHRETLPPNKESMLVWDEDFRKFSKNFNVEYSPYLTKLYSFEKSRDYSEIWAKKATTWNSTIARVKAGKKMTPLNEERLEEMRKEGYSIEELVSKMSDEPIEEETAIE